MKIYSRSFLILVILNILTWTSGENFVYAATFNKEMEFRRSLFSRDLEYASSSYLAHFTNISPNIYTFNQTEFRQVKGFLEMISELETQRNYSEMIPLIESLFPIFEKTSSSHYDSSDYNLTVKVFLAILYYFEYKDYREIPNHVVESEITASTIDLISGYDSPQEALSGVIRGVEFYTHLETAAGEDRLYSGLLALLFMSLYRDLANYYSGLDEFQPVEIDIAQTRLFLEAALELGESHLSNYVTNDLRTLLARVYRAEGNSPEAIEQLEQLEQEQNEWFTFLNQENLTQLDSDQYSFIVTYFSLVVSNIDVGNFDEAERLLRIIPEIEIQNQLNISFLPEILDEVSLLHSYLYFSDGRYEQAISLLESILSKPRIQRSEYRDAFRSMLALTYLYKGDTSKAANLLSTDKNLIDNLSRLELMAVASQYEPGPGFLIPLSILAFDQKDYDSAEKYLALKLPYASRQDWSHRDLANLYSLLGITRWLLGEIQEAEDAFKTSIELTQSLSKYTLYYGSESQKVEFLETLSRTLNPIIHVHLNTKNKNMANMAFSAMLERKGRVVDFFSSSYTILRQQLNSEGQRILEEMNSVRNQIASKSLSYSPEANLEEDFDEIFQLYSQLAELESQASSQVTKIDNNLINTNLEDIAALIPQDAALVEFFVYRPVNPENKFGEMFGEERYAAYLLRPDGYIEGIDLGSVADIDLLIADLSSVIRNPNVRSSQVQETSRTLDEALLTPIRAYLGETQHLLISPDAALNLVPFEVLVSESNRYLIEDYQITYLTSGRDLLRLQLNVSAEEPPLLIANPIYGSEPSTFEGFYPPLPGTIAETTEIASILPASRLRQGLEATESSVKQVSRPNILHIATHSFFESTSPLDITPTENPMLRSALLLTGFKDRQIDPGEDGILTAFEVASLDLLGTQLVVLSACETGAGDISVGEGVYGLRRALLLAGSESQIISLWQVKDDSAKDLMVSYYNRLLQGEGRGAALRNTQLEMIDSDGFSHPYYWAPFIQSGDWTPLASLQE